MFVSNADVVGSVVGSGDSFRSPRFDVSPVRYGHDRCRGSVQVSS